jgi:putative hydrolase of the HAD superfamily
MGLAPPDVLFVGNDLYRDVHGPQKLGIKTVFFQSGETMQDKGRATPDYIIYSFPELLNAVRFFEDGDRRQAGR